MTMKEMRNTRVYKIKSSTAVWEIEKLYAIASCRLFHTYYAMSRKEKVVMCTFVISMHAAKKKLYDLTLHSAADVIVDATLTLCLSLACISLCFYATRL